MALTADVKLIRYGSNRPEPLNIGLKAATTVYRGSIAVMKGVGTSAGQLINATSASSGDEVMGLIDFAGPGVADTDPGIVGGATDGAVTVEVATGSFLLASASGADQLSAATAGQTVYLVDEVTVGATNNGGLRPVAGIQLPAGDLASLVGGLFPIKVGTKSSPLGGP